jgi:hypothetical protein
MIRFCILGEPASKANSREIGVLKFRDKATGEAKTRPTVRKSDKALAYEESALRQVPPAARQRLEGPVRVTLRIWYASERQGYQKLSSVLFCQGNRSQGLK